MAIKRIINVLGLIACVALIGASDSRHASPAHVSQHIALKNVELIDQNGSPIRFASEVLGDRIVALNFIYTSCQTACPLVSAIFSNLQAQLGQKLESQVRMVSLSINPSADTPAKLKQYSERYRADPNWIWLTGEKRQIDSLLRALGVYTSDYTNHAPVIMVGDPQRGVWTRIVGLPSPANIVAKIDALLADRRLN